MSWPSRITRSSRDISSARARMTASLKKTLVGIPISGVVSGFHVFHRLSRRREGCGVGKCRRDRNLLVYRRLGGADVEPEPLREEDDRAAGLPGLDLGERP